MSGCKSNKKNFMKVVNSATLSEWFVGEEVHCEFFKRNSMSTSFWGTWVWIYNVRFRGWTIPFKTESGKLAKLQRRRHFVAQCQERGLGWGLGGALGWGQLQLVGSEVTNRCPSQPPTPGCFSFVGVLISRTAKLLSKLWHATWEQNKIIKNISNRETLFGPTQWLFPLKQQINTSCLDILHDIQ